jgi:hypothetical protein
MNSSSSTLASGGSASAAVAKANSAIENARRAAASSRASRVDCGMAMPSSARYITSKSSDGGKVSNSGMANTSSARYTTSPAHSASKSSGGGGKVSDSGNFDLKSNDNAYHVIATLITDRLLPKLQMQSSYYTLSSEDTAFFQKMLPYSVRRKFVDALRHRLQSIKSSGDVRGKTNSALVKLTKQCQLLGLDREEKNALLDLSNNTGVRYPVSRDNHQDIPLTSSYDLQERPYAHANDYTATTQQPSMYGGGSYDNGMVSSPMAYQNNDGYNNGDFEATYEATAESLARQQIMAEINETKFLMQGSATPEAKLFWQKHLHELNERVLSLNMGDQGQSRGGGGGGVGFGPQIEQRSQVENYGFSGNQAADNYYEEDPRPAVSPRRGGLSTCEVVAPSDLPGGYMFEAQLGDQKFLATVPSGGVTKGQQFVSTMKELEMIEIPVTMGGWKDDLCECFNAGMCHPLLLNGIFFPCSKFSVVQCVSCFFAILLIIINHIVVNTTSCTWSNHDTNRIRLASPTCQQTCQQLVMHKHGCFPILLDCSELQCSSHVHG